MLDCSGSQININICNLKVLKHKDRSQYWEYLHSGKKIINEGRGYTLNGMRSKTYIESR